MYVKQNDFWHIVDPKGERDPKERRPTLRAMCGRSTHTGTFEQPIDDGHVCGSAEHRKAMKLAADALEGAKDAEGLTPADVETIDQQIGQLGRFCTGA